MFDCTLYPEIIITAIAGDTWGLYAGRRERELMWMYDGLRSRHLKKHVVHGYLDFDCIVGVKNCASK
jgi:hypothetical protein